jgi:hypothetical protein
VNLFDALPIAPRIDGIDLRCCSIEDILGGDALGATLVVADPPWIYENVAGDSDPEDRYSCLSIEQIGAHLQVSTRHAPNARLALWLTWPILAQEWDVAQSPLRRIAGWQCISGGAWEKTEHQGVGHHWLGRSEPVLLYRRGSPPTNRVADLGNAHASHPGEHSVKPITWMREWIRRWTEPGDLVLDLYAGLGSVAIAAMLEGRRYVGAEINPERHARAMDRLRRARRGEWV